MNVLEEKIDDLNTILRVKISVDDYSEKVENTLKDYRKQVNLPGFRQGKTPMNLIKRKYGRAVLAEELNKAVNQSLQEFITSNNLNVLGNPLPKEDEEIKGDFDDPSEFEFAYEIGISPDFDLKISKKDKFDYLSVDISKEMLDKEVDNLARRYGKLVPEEEVGERDMVVGEFTEIGGEITNNSTISLEFVEDKTTKKELLGSRVGDTLILDPVKVSKNETDMAAMLGVPKEEVLGLKSKFNFKINEIKRMIPADIDQGLFDKLFGEGTIKSEEELRIRIKDDLVKMFASDSDRIFNQKVIDAIVDKTKVNLPEGFLKRWILASSTEEITPDQVEADFDSYKKSLKWQLIQNKIIKENKIRVEPLDAADYVRALLIDQFAQYGMPAPKSEELEAQVKNMLSNQEEANRIYDNLYTDRIMTFIKDAVNLNVKALPYDKFIAKAYQA